jgi:transposase
VPSGIIFINRNGLRWHDAPKRYGPPKTLCCRWKRWGDKGIFARMMEGPAFGAAVPTRCDQCPQVFLSAVTVAAIVLFRR